MSLRFLRSIRYERRTSTSILVQSAPKRRVLCVSDANGRHAKLPPTDARRSLIHSL